MALARVAVLTAIGCSLSSAVAAQPLGVFRWQQQPYCNVLTLNVVQAGAVYQLDGTDNQCGAATQAAVSGLAFPNPDGTIGMGLAVVTTPGGSPLHLDATITLASVGGTWRDSTGATGAFVFTLGGVVAGSPRPAPRPAFPAGLTVGGGTITNLAAPVAPGDAVNKAYADGISAAVRTAMLGDRVWPAFVSAIGTKVAPGRYTTSRTGFGQYTVTFDVSGLGVPYSAAVPIWILTPFCDHGHPSLTFANSTSEPGGATLATMTTRLEVRNTAGVLVDCGVMMLGVVPDADAPGSPIAPLLAAGAEPVTCTTTATVTTCAIASPHEASRRTRAR